MNLNTTTRLKSKYMSIHNDRLVPRVGVGAEVVMGGELKNIDNIIDILFHLKI